MNVTAHFTVAELEHSVTAEKLGINNAIPARCLDNLQRVCEVLEKLRTEIHPIIVTSGYRCEALNKAVGGVSNSYHLQGRAIDFTCSDLPHAWDVLNDLKIRTGEITELIFYQKSNFIHVAV